MLVRPQPVNAGCRQNQGVAATLLKLAQSRVEISPHRHIRQIATNASNCVCRRGLPVARRTPRRKLLKYLALPGNQHVARVLARRHGAKNQSLRLHRGQIFQAVHGNIDRAREQGFLDLLDEQTLAAGLRNRLCHRSGHRIARRDSLEFVAGGFDNPNFYFIPCRGQLVTNPIGLPKSEFGTARSNDEFHMKSWTGHVPLPLSTSQPKDFMNQPDQSRILRFTCTAL